MSEARFNKDREPLDPAKEPLIVALYAGPGTGKSTTAAGVFHALKQAGINTELVGEVAKGLTWERNWKALGHQGLIHGLQTYEYDKLAGEVDVIVTDTSPLLSLVHARGRHTSREFREYVAHDWSLRNTLDIFLVRDPQRPYNPKGRRQSRESAEAMDARTLTLLDCCAVDYHLVNLAAGNAVEKIAFMASERM